MEQLAHFVTKSFEYNNNRVMEVLNMSTKSNSSSISLNNDSSDIISNSDLSVIENDIIGDNGDDNSVDIDITDLSSNDEKSNVDIMTSPLPLVKKSSRNCEINNKSSAVTKNWLISDFSPSSRANSNISSKFLILNDEFVALIYFKIQLISQLSCNFLN